MTQKCMVNLSVPFDNDQLAVVARNSIDADEVPNVDLVKRTIEVDGNNLNVTIVCEDLFKLRTSLNNYIEAVLQVKKTIKRFNYDNHGVH
jgi:tRNA threonylcarbamoyladenosine modification (KEOPS) complex  Pcc1 subunit